MKIILSCNCYNDNTTDVLFDVLCYDISNRVYVSITEQEREYLLCEMQKHNLDFVVEECDVYVGLYDLFTLKDVDEYMYNIIYDKICNAIDVDTCYKCYTMCNNDVNKYHNLLVSCGMYNEIPQA